MKRIAITTITNLSNYGNRLQNYALQQNIILRQLSATTLWNQKYPMWIKKAAKKILKVQDGSIALRNFSKESQDSIITARVQTFEKFNRKYITPYITTNINGYLPQHLNKSFDFFIVGSDQVWNPLFWKKTPEAAFNNFFLRFASPEKRIAYAASFGIDTLPQEWEERMAAEFVKFKAISVRETAGAKIIKKLTSMDVPVVLDPTLLLTAEQWRPIEPHLLTGNEKYVLTYFLGLQPEDVKREVQERAKEFDAEVIELMDFKSPYYTLGPDGFLEMIDHAQAVFTDSFHGTVFSILFHKPFYVYQRHMSDGLDMSSRIDTLLEKTQLTDCVLNKRIATKEEYARADALLAAEREKSLLFLQTALQ